MLTNKELKSFKKYGYAGVHEVYDGVQISEVCQEYKNIKDQVSPIYDEVTPRDTHLFSKIVYDLCTHSKITQRVAQILGPDVLLWRTQFFEKKPASLNSQEGVIDWHQGIRFPGPKKQPSLKHAEGVTAWIALTDANIENGCLQIIARTHKRQIPVIRTKESGIFGRGVKLDLKIKQKEIKHICVPAGHCFLFSPLLVHGSDVNRTQNSRIGIAARFVKTSNVVYEGLEKDGQGLPLAKYGCVLVSGEDKYNHNKILQPF